MIRHLFAFLFGVAVTLAGLAADELVRREDPTFHAAQVIACGERGGELLWFLSGGRHVLTCAKNDFPVAWRAPQ